MSGVNQKTREQVIISITFGSGFQKRYGLEMLKVFFSTFGKYFEEQHKENKFSYQIKKF